MQKPCYGCTKETGRSPECHCQCRSYLDYRAALDAARAAKTKERKAWNAYHETREAAVRKANRHAILGGMHHG